MSADLDDARLDELEANMKASHAKSLERLDQKVEAARARALRHHQIPGVLPEPLTAGVLEGQPVGAEEPPLDHGEGLSTLILVEAAARAGYEAERSLTIARGDVDPGAWEYADKDQRGLRRIAAEGILGSEAAPETYGDFALFASVVRAVGSHCKGGS